MTPKAEPDKEKRVLIANRKARHNYEILETVEAGLALVGTEVKSLRAGKANMGDCYGVIENEEAFLVQLHISPYTQGNLFNHDPLRKRKLLLHKAQIRRLRVKIEERGLTLVPLALLLVKNRVKVELALGRGKKLYDKREAKARQDADRDLQRVRREHQ
jgi:SsrA-binding protein